MKRAILSSCFNDVDGDELRVIRFLWTLRREHNTRFLFYTIIIDS